MKNVCIEVNMGFCCLGWISFWMAEKVKVHFGNDICILYRQKHLKHSNGLRLVKLHIPRSWHDLL